MSRIFIGGAAEAAAAAEYLKSWLLANGVDSVTLDSESDSAAHSLDTALKSLAGCDAVILLASPLGRARLSFAPEASAAAFSNIPILLVGWPGVDLRTALPAHVHASSFVEAPGEQGFSDAGEAALRAFLAGLRPSEAEAAEDGFEALSVENAEELEIVDDAPLAPPVIDAGGARDGQDRIDWDIDDGFALDEESADAATAERPGEAADSAKPVIVAESAPPPAAPATPAPSSSRKVSLDLQEPGGFDIASMLIRSPGAVIPTGDAVRRVAGLPGPGGARTRASRNGALNAADRTRDDISDGAAAGGGSGAMIATGVILAAAAAAAFLFGPKIVEWLGLGAAIAIPVGGTAQPAEGDRVEASVFAPPSVARGDVARVQVFLSTREQREEARATAQEQDPSASRRAGRVLSTNLRRGAEIEVALVALDQLGRVAFNIDAQTEAMVWEGEAVSVDFFIEAKMEASLRQHRLAAMLLRDGKPIGELRFAIAAVAARGEATAAPLMAPANTASEIYRNIFLSYAREDIDAVRLVARSYRMLDQDFFWDVDDLEPGQSWEEELERRISKADVFVLFWSAAAHDSEWVRREVEMALAREAVTGKPRFMPFPIEGPPPADPWESIASRHIGDPLYFRAVQAARKKIENPQEK